MKIFKKYFWTFLITVLLIFIMVCSRLPIVAEWYMQNCYPKIAAVLSFFSRIIPFSFFDLLIIAAIIALLGGIAMVCMKRLSLLRFGKLFILTALWIAVWFYMAWGIAYFRPDFYERFGIEPPVEDKEFFEQLVLLYIDSLNRTYVAEPYFFDSNEVKTEIETLYSKHHEILQLRYPTGWRRNKKTMLAPVMTKMGIAGFFAPFFNEIKVNRFSLPITYPYTLAHEMAHQFGIASEAEANLYATVICTSSSHPLVRYSGYLQTVSYLLGTLRKTSPTNYREIMQKIDPRVLADFRAIREHWHKAINPTLSAAQDRVYDAYLRTNRQESGILSYSEVTGLIVAWAEKEL